jgi:hypothetical protein
MAEIGKPAAVGLCGVCLAGAALADYRDYLEGIGKSSGISPDVG